VGRIIAAKGSTCPLYTGLVSSDVRGQGHSVFDKLLDGENSGKPLMRPYLEGYFDMYWDLHLGIKGDAIPERVRQFGKSFNTVFAYRDPTQKIVYENYMTVRSNLSFLKGWY